MKFFCVCRICKFFCNVWACRANFHHGNELKLCCPLSPIWRQTINALLSQSSAQQEELRLHQLQRQKEAKLRQFQDEVRRRVVAIDRLKHMQQLQKSQIAVRSLFINLQTGHWSRMTGRSSWTCSTCVRRNCNTGSCKPWGHEVWTAGK